MPALAWIGALFAVLCGTASAHTVTVPQAQGPGLGDLLATALPMAIAAILYVRGYLVLGRLGTRGTEARRWRALAFVGGLAMLALALLSPIDTWSAELFTWHMIQHEVLLLLAAPLLVLGTPLPVFLWAFSGSARTALSSLAQHRGVRRAWRFLLHPAVACMVHAAVLWLWHAPSLFNAALVNRGVHDVQHLSFFLSALVFWAALFQQRAREQQGAAVLYLFVTTVHSSVLGTLITFAARPWYDSYLLTTARWNLSALEDQQLGGLIMWVPGSMVYIGAALALLARWILASDARFSTVDDRNA